MNGFNQLPVEILSLIFSEIDNKQLLELESVCKHWKNVLRSRVQYWNSEIELDCQSINDIKGLEHFILKILSRSKGEMQSWRIKVASSALKCYQDLFEQISTSNPHSLDIEITDLDRYSIDHLSYRLFEGEIRALMNTIKQCSCLKSLKISVDSDLIVSFGSDLKDFPIASCKLETLKLDNINLESVLIDGSILKIVTQAKYIDISGRYGIEDIIPLLVSAKDTLEICSINLPGMTGFEDTIRIITLPRLKRLQVFTYHGLSALTNTILIEPIQCSFICPNLRHLTLSGDITSSQCASLLTDSIGTLNLELNEYLCNSLLNELRKCSYLSTLRMTIVYSYQGKFPSQLLEEVLDELILLPLKEFVLSFMVTSNQEKEQIILNFFKRWSKDSKKMKLFLLYQDVQLSKEILKELAKYCEVVKVFARDQYDSTYSEEELQLRTYGYTIGR